MQSNGGLLLSDGDSEEDETTSGSEDELYPCLPKEEEEEKDKGDKEGEDKEEPEFRISLYELAKTDEKTRRVIKSRLRRKKRTRVQKKKMTRNNVLRRSLGKMRESCACCTWACARSFLRRFFPFLGILKGYSALYDLPCDLIAGLTVGIMHIPQGMAYALLARLPPVYGLYTSFYPVLLYFFFGTSKHISVGTFAVVSLMVGAVVEDGHVAWERQQSEVLMQNDTSSLITTENLTVTGQGQGQGVTSATDPGLLPGAENELEQIKVAYAMSVTFAVGVMQIFLGLVRLGFLTSFLSDPLISGFTTGAAVHVLSSQLHSIFGIPVGQYSGSFKLIYGYRDFFVNLNQVNYVTMTASFSAMLVLVLIRDGINNNKKHCPNMRVPVPIELIVIIGATLLSYYLEINEEFHVEVIGDIPRGLPKVDLTMLRFLPDVLGEAFAICFTAFALSFAIAKILADKHDYAVDANQELVAHGLTNVIGSMCSSYCSSASLSRSVVQEEVGGKTQISSLISAVLILIVLLVVGPLFKPLPNCILAAIIVVSLKRLFLQFADLRRLWKVSKIDFTVWLVVFWCTVLLDVDLGLLVGLVYNLVPILLRTQKPYVCLLGNIEGTEMYADLKVHKEAREVPGVKIFRFEAPLYFANVDHFKRSLVAETHLDPKELQREQTAAKETDMSLRHEQVCLGTTSTWPEDPCEGHSHAAPLGEGGARIKTSLPAAVSGGVFAIVVDGSTIQYIDSVTARVLRELIQEYKDIGIEMYLGECKPTVRAMLDKSGFYVHVPRRHVCATIHHAVNLALQSASDSLESIPPPENGISSSFVRLDLATTEDEHDQH
ncbi:solute carrier family 26 member 6-like [Babylonia areolata]|uniref:solute carrier family 26 member 6-like n=1 Tax=Babylonia areolata TaxID=304850 RepID=UPI003FD683EB